MSEKRYRYCENDVGRYIVKEKQNERFIRCIWCEEVGFRHEETAKSIVNLLNEKDKEINNLKSANTLMQY